MKKEEFNYVEKPIEKLKSNFNERKRKNLNGFIDFEDFYYIEKEVFEKLSILNLQRFITKDLMVSEEQILTLCSDKDVIKDEKQIKIAQIIISEIDNQNNDLAKKNLLIKDFLSKLASHIKKELHLKPLQNSTHSIQVIIMVALQTGLELKVQL
jgi:hypothetical protein